MRIQLHRNRRSLLVLFQNRKRVLIVIVLSLCLYYICNAYLFRRGLHEDTSSRLSITELRPGSGKNALLFVKSNISSDPTNEQDEGKQSSKRNIHREVMHDNIDVIWEAPGSFVPVNEYRGILFVAHGCSHSHTDFWPRTARNTSYGDFVCSECLGLVEEVALVRIAVDLFRLVVVTISSIDRHNTRCWNVQNDAPRVATVLKTMLRRIESSSSTLGKTTALSRVNGENNNAMDSRYFQSNKTLPILAFGAEWGGAFVPWLGRALINVGENLAGYIAQLLAQNHTSFLTDNLRCAVYITMLRDRHNDQNARYIVHELQHRKNVSARHLQIAPLPLDEQFFANRIPFITMEISRQMFQALLQNNMLYQSNSRSNDPEEGFQLIRGMYYLVDDPRYSSTHLRQPPKWRAVLRPYVPVTLDTFENDQSSVGAAMNAAYGFHETTRDGVHDAIEFCLDHV